MVDTSHLQVEKGLKRIGSFLEEQVKKSRMDSFRVRQRSSQNGLAGCLRLDTGPAKLGCISIPGGISRDAKNWNEGSVNLDVAREGGMK
jgi:hypothetical protein